MNKELQLWAILPENSKRNILSAINKETKLPTDAIEKDWWVVQMLRLIFEMDCADSLVFKGGASLGKKSLTNEKRIIWLRNSI